MVKSFITADTPSHGMGVYGMGWGTTDTSIPWDGGIWHGMGVSGVSVVINDLTTDTPIPWNGMGYLWL